MRSRTLVWLLFIDSVLLLKKSSLEILTNCRDCWCVKRCDQLKFLGCITLCFHKVNHPKNELIPHYFNQDESIQDYFNIQDGLTLENSNNIHLYSTQFNEMPRLVITQNFNKLHFTAGKIVIDCNDFSLADMSTLNTTINDLIPQYDFRSNAKDLTLNGCPFPDEPFQPLLSKLNTTSVDILVVIGSPSNFSLIPVYFDEHFVSVNSISFINNTGLKSLHEDVFKGTPQLFNIVLQGNNITTLDPGVFRDLRNLVILDLSYNGITDLKPDIFQGLTSLRELNINYNELVTLKSDLFSNLPNLKELFIQGNYISVLDSGIFYGNITLLNLNDNEITSVEPGVFEHLTNLIELYLSYNSITDLDPGIFKDLTSLKILQISNNRLISLPQELFRNCHELEELNLNENQLIDLKGTPFILSSKLTTLFLSGNGLEKITDGMFNGTHGLAKLDLSHNKLNDISQPAFDILCNENSILYSIDLSNNILEWNSTELVDNPFHNCQHLQSLRLSNNRISYIHDDWIMGMPNLHELFLDGNNITKLRDYNYTSLSKSLFLNVSYNQIKTVELESIDYYVEADVAYYVDVLLPKENQTKLKGPSDGIKIVLNENPITCDCSNYGLFYFLQYFLKGYGSKMIDIESQNVTCKPWNKSIDEVHPKTLTCNNVDGCPSLCNCSHSPFYDRTTVDCSSVNLEQMPQDLNVTYKSRTPRKITLILRNNSIQQFLRNPSENYKLVTDLDLSLNAIKDWKVDIVQHFPHLEKLNLSHNHLESLSEDFFNSSSYSNISSMSLSANPWACGCDNLTKRLHTFVMTNGHILKDLNQITCSGSNQPLNKWNPIDFCSTTSNQHLIVVIIILGSLGVLFGLLVIMYYKYQHQIKVWLFAHGILLCWVSEEDIDQDKVYDAFVSYAEGDYGFVVHTLLPELEKSFRICHHLRDFIGGEWITDQIYQKVNQSRRTIIVLTENFLNSVYGVHEFRTAHAQSIADNCARVIILILGDMPPQEAMPDEMKAYMSMNTYLKWGDKWFWDKLKYALPHPPPRPIHECPLVERSRILMNPSSSVGDNN